MITFCKIHILKHKTIYLFVYLLLLLFFFFGKLHLMFLIFIFLIPSDLQVVGFKKIKKMILGCLT